MPNSLNLKPNKKIAKQTKKTKIISYQELSLMSATEIAKLEMTPPQFVYIAQMCPIEILLNTLKYHSHLVNEANTFGTTALISAIHRPIINKVEALLAAGADPDLKTLTSGSAREWLATQLASGNDHRKNRAYQKCLDCITKYDEQSMRVINESVEETTPCQKSDSFEINSKVSTLNADAKATNDDFMLERLKPLELESDFDTYLSFPTQSIESTPSLLNLSNSSSSQHPAKSDEQTINIHDSTDFFHSNRVFKH